MNEKGWLVTSSPLTKQWLMAVRRGWLSLLKPTVNTFKDAYDAVTKLMAFVTNLKEQVLYVNRGPYVTVFQTERDKLLKEVDRVWNALREARSTVVHWSEASEGKYDHLDPSRKDSGIKMLDYYRKDFAGVIESWDNNPRKSKNNPYGNPVKIPAEELIDGILKLLYEEAKKRKDYEERNPETPLDSDREAFKEFDLYGVKVIVLDEKVTAIEIEEYIRFLDMTYRALTLKGFKEIWRGKIFIDCKECGGENPYGKQFGVGGHYFVGKDFVKVYSRPSPFIVELVSHELAHKFWYKDLSSGQREEFRDYFSTGEIPAVSRYGTNSADEAFAEVIAYIVSGKDIGREQLDSLKAILNRGKIPGRLGMTLVDQVAQRYVASKQVMGELDEETKRERTQRVQEVYKLYRDTLNDGIEKVLEAKGNLYAKVFLPALRSSWLNDQEKDDVSDYIRGTSDHTDFWAVTAKWEKPFPDRDPFETAWGVAKKNLAKEIQSIKARHGKHYDNASKLRKVGMDIIACYRDVTHAILMWPTRMGLLVPGNVPGYPEFKEKMYELLDSIDGWDRRVDFATRPSGYPETSPIWLLDLVRDSYPSVEALAKEALVFFGNLYKSMAKKEQWIQKVENEEEKVKDLVRQVFSPAFPAFFMESTKEWQERYNWEVLDTRSHLFDVLDLTRRECSHLWNPFFNHAVENLRDAVDRMEKQTIYLVVEKGWLIRWRRQPVKTLTSGKPGLPPSL